MLTLWTTENKDVLSSKRLALELKLPDRSFVYFKNNNGCRIQPCGTPAWTSVHDKF